MLPREFSTWGQPFCRTGLDHARDDELGALGLRGRDIRSSRGSSRAKSSASSVGGDRAASKVGVSRGAMRERTLRQQ